jgi:hypothetical protein
MSSTTHEELVKKLQEELATALARAAAAEKSLRALTKRVRGCSECQGDSDYEGGCECDGD